MNELVKKERDYYFDNAKFVLIFLVVLGHLFEPFMQSTEIKTLYIFIYLFHMPAFIFITGYFSRNYDSVKAREKLINLIIIYCIFQIAYLAFHSITINPYFKIKLFMPYWILWYLFSLITWRFLLPFIVRFKYPLVVTLILAVAMGYVIDAGYPFSISRTFSFFPFFIAGFLFKKEYLKYKKHILVKIGAGIILAVLFASCFFKPFFFNQAWLYGSVGYNTLAKGNMFAGGYKIILLAIQFLAMASFLALIPSFKNPLSFFGTKTIYVFLLHGFIIKACVSIDIFGDYFKPAWSKLLLFPLALGIVIFLSSPLVTNIFKYILETNYMALRIKDLKKAGKFISNHKWFIIATIIIFITDLCSIYLFNIKNSIEISTRFLILSVIWKFFIDWSLCFTICFILIKLLKNSIPATLFFSFYLFIMLLDILIYYYSSTFFQYEYISYTTWYSVKGFLSYPFFIAALFFFLSISGIYFIFNHYKKRIQYRTIIIVSFFLILVVLFNAPSFAIQAMINNPKDNHHIENDLLKEKRRQVNTWMRSSFVNFLLELTVKQKKKIHIVKDYKKYDDILSKVGLGPGKKEYTPLNLTSFNKVILITVESYSLSLLSEYNKTLKDQGLHTAPYMGSPEIKEKIFTNFHTIRKPTLPGLTTIHHSHPNPDLFYKGYNRYALPVILRDNGFKTIFLRSASRYYSSENLIFKRYGFDTTIAREEFEEDPQYKDYISGWGPCDRLIYDKVIELLKESNNKKLFINVLGTDTHAPTGRENYHGLSYPEIPASFKKFSNNTREYLRSIYYKDHDIKRLIGRIKQEGLFTDDTLIIITADHASHDGILFKELPGMQDQTRIPLVFLTNQQLPEVDKTIVSSQLDLAPTILHLLDIDVPECYWGESIFSTAKKPGYILAYDKRAIVLQGKKQTIFDFTKPDETTHKIKELVNSVQE